MALDLDTLNEPQYEAVKCTEGPLLVLAGAGSGKTRVLTYRIAHMLEDKDVAPWQILAITFTNKAAAEMRDRLSSMIGGSAKGMWVSTFHSACVRMLRGEAERLGFTRNFTIYDATDSKRLMKGIMADLDVNTKAIPVNAVMNRVSIAKNELIVPGEFSATAIDPIAKQAARIYPVYQERLKQANAMDFDDLLLYTYLLLSQHEDVLSAYQDRFRYILVDEYQDTNHAQYEIVKLLAAQYRNLMVVGDDDQSIYSWRGADIRNILEFEHDYPEAAVVKLEENYRSCGNILKAANAVISNNRQRKQKRLFTSGSDGERVGIYVATDERDEGRWIAGEIEKAHASGETYDEMAIFYRTNAQSRVLEDMLLRAGVPYRIVGGTKFFDRAEIRDVMAYLSLVVNPSDDVSFERVLNVPKRGIGKTTLELIRTRASELRMSEFSAAETLLAEEGIRKATKESISSFLNIIKQAQAYSGDLREVVERIVDDSGIIESLKAEHTDEALARVENVRELLGVVQEFQLDHDVDDALFEPPSASPASDASDGTATEAYASGPNADGAAHAGTMQGEEPDRELRGDSLEDLIEWIRLRTDLDSMSADGKAVTLMTVHSAKGLEFDTVFVAGMEEGIFPHMNSVSTPEGLEEERRLAYVAITRARRKLKLTCAQTRSLYGQTGANPVSRFLGEIPEEVRKTVGLGSEGFSGSGWEKRGSRRGISGSGSEAGSGHVFGRSSASGAGRRGMGAKGGKEPKAKAVKFAKGDRIDHKTFGRGIVLGVDGDTIKVKFSDSGQVKKLLVGFAPIVKIGESNKIGGK